MNFVNERYVQKMAMPAASNFNVFTVAIPYDSICHLMVRN